jgi:non-ribosomal peptide synthetase component F
LEEKDTIKGDIEYNIDVFERSTIIRLKNNFVHLVHSIADYPDKRLSEITAISDTEQEKIEGFNSTILSIPDCLVQDFFEQQSVIQPTKNAVICGNSSLTYKELNEKANQIARHLISLGAKGGDVVGICLDRSVEMIISVFGVLKAGCCYLPMDPSFPDDRLNFMFEDSEARVLITQKLLRNRFLQVADKPIILIDADKKKINKNSTEKPDIKLNSQTPIYTIYTSGSTGRPKGVKAYHKAVVNLIESMSKRPGIKEDDILLAVVTLSFDMSVYELFVPLSKGATVVVAGSQEMTDGAAIIDLIDRYKVSVIQATPSFWSILLSSGWKGKKNLKALCGGEALTKNLVNQILPKVIAMVRQRQQFIQRVFRLSMWIHLL